MATSHIELVTSHIEIQIKYHANTNTSVKTIKPPHHIADTLERKSIRRTENYRHSVASYFLLRAHRFYLRTARTCISTSNFGQEVPPTA